MKRFLTIFFIIMLQSGVCFAEDLDESIENINNLFVEDAYAEEIVPIAEEKKPVENIEQAQPTAQSDENTIEVALSKDNTENADSAQLQGYLEYNEEPEADYEQNAVYFDGSDIATKINFATPKKITSKSLLGNKKPTFQPLHSELSAASRFSSQEYIIQPISASFTQKVGKFSFGTDYGSSLDSASSGYSTSVFSKYDTKHFALSTSFSKSTNLNDVEFSDKIYIIPELKITKRLSLLNVLQTDVHQISKKNEVVLRYTPNIKNHADEVQFEIGAGQTFYNDEFVKSSLRFSTKFKL